MKQPCYISPFTIATSYQLLHLTNCYISPTATSHRLPHLTNCHISPTATSHQLLHLTNCYISPTATSHQLPHLTNCYISPTATSHQLPHLTNCHISPTATSHQLLHLTNCHISPTAQSALKCRAEAIFLSNCNASMPAFERSSFHSRKRGLILQMAVASSVLLQHFRCERSGVGACFLITMGRTQPVPRE